MKFVKPVGGRKIFLVSWPSDKFENMLLDFLKGAPKQHKTLLVSLTRTYDAFVMKFKERKIDLQKFFIIDCVSSTLKLKKEKHDNCTYFHLPNNLQNLMKAIHDTSERVSPEYILFDSLSNLTSYRSVLSGKFSTFLIDITNMAKLKHKTLILFSTIGDLETFKFIFDKTDLKVDVLVEEAEG